MKKERLQLTTAIFFEKMFMKMKGVILVNICELDILKALYLSKNANQRVLAMETGYSLGRVNKAIMNLKKENVIDDELKVNPSGIAKIKRGKTRRAIILAAGYGMRMAPIGNDIPKALLEVNGEPLIERQIKQLHEVGITDITVVVGYMKERFEYLIDDYGVNLVVNLEYSTQNNLHSLSLVSEDLDNTYILPSDLYFINNPFSKLELYSWYMISNEKNGNSNVYVNRKLELVKTTDDLANGMVGLAFISEEDSSRLKQNLKTLDEEKKYKNSFWEEALIGDDKDKMFISAKIIDSSKYVEINTYEQLRELDNKSKNLDSEVIDLISNVLKCDRDEIGNIAVLKKGMTNRSFQFEVRNNKYIMRVPGEGTDQLINRKEEYDVYKAIEGKGICDAPVYLNPSNGYKITKYLDNVRSANSEDVGDLKKCMKKLKEFHNLNLQVDHDFDLFGQILFYEKLRDGKPSIYRDYENTKKNVFKLKKYIDKHVAKTCLTHIDAVPDNFLFYEDENGKERLQLTDWEYSGMQDPHVDIAMFSIYSLYDKDQIDTLINLYFEDECATENRIKIYCYIAVAGLLWSNWCEYKLALGVEFGEYAMKQYRYAKEYYRIVQEELEKTND